MSGNSHILVIPFDIDLLRDMKGHAVVVKSENPHEINQIDECVNQSGAHLHCIWLTVKAPLSSIPAGDDWGSIPVALHVDESGTLRALRGKLKMLSRLNLKVFLPSDCSESFTRLRILSSLGIACGVSFNGAVADWEALSELMHYAIYGRVEHGPIEPFHSVASCYQASRITDFSSVYFNNPRHYLHCDGSGRTALTAGHLRDGIFIGTFPEAINAVEKHSHYREYFNAWRSAFLTFTDCACCAGWRVCGGTFRDYQGARQTCTGLMSDLLEGAEFYQKKLREQKLIWQSSL